MFLKKKNEKSYLQTPIQHVSLNGDAWQSLSLIIRKLLNLASADIWMTPYDVMNLKNVANDSDLTLGVLIRSMISFY